MIFHGQRLLLSGRTQPWQQRVCILPSESLYKSLEELQHYFLTLLEKSQLLIWAASGNSSLLRKDLTIFFRRWSRGRFSWNAGNLQLLKWWLIPKTWRRKTNRGIFIWLEYTSKEDLCLLIKNLCVEPFLNALILKNSRFRTLLKFDSNLWNALKKSIRRKLLQWTIIPVEKNRV